MASLDETLLAPIAGADPCGENLEYDAAFAALERRAQGKPEQQIGSTIVPAEEPDWKAVERDATELFGRSKDLRVGATLAQALLRTKGWAGFADGLAVLRGLIEQYWEGFHPRLDPDDGNDPTMRVNILLQLTEGSVLNAIRATPLVSSRVAGRYGLKEIEIASGETPAPEGGAAPSTANIDAAILDSDLAALETTAAKTKACAESVAAIESTLMDKVGSSNAADFGKLPSLLKKAAAFMAKALDSRAPSPAGGESGDGAPAEGGGGGRARGGALSGEISSRDDVIKALDKILAYYSRYEPSSPIPMFMERCKRLVPKSFMDIVRDLVPEAVTQVEHLRGPTE